MKPVQRALALRAVVVVVAGVGADAIAQLVPAMPLKRGYRHLYEAEMEAHNKLKQDYERLAFERDGLKNEVALLSSKRARFAVTNETTVEQLTCPCCQRGVQVAANARLLDE